MTPKRFAISWVVLFLFALIWNAFIHLVLLAPLEASVQHLRRADFADKLWLSLFLTAALVALFIWGFHRFVDDGTLARTVGYGVFFALLAGVLVDLNQYVLYPIPAHVAAAWFVSGLFEFVVYALILRKILSRRQTPQQV